jgi:hypothetical protein
MYIERGVETPLARQVAQQLMTRDALGAHARLDLWRRYLTIHIVTRASGLWHGRTSVLRPRWRPGTR